MNDQIRFEGEKGNFALLAALVLALIVGFFALVIDVGFLNWTGNREEDLAESAALVAVKELDSTQNGIQRAISSAENLVKYSDINNEFKFNKNSDITFGIWDGNQFINSSDANNINAVKINIERNSSKGNPVKPLVAGVFSIFDKNFKSNIDLNEFAIAATGLNGPPNNSNIFPLAINSCDLSKNNVPFNSNNASLACGREIVFGDDPQVTETQCSCACFSIVRNPSFTKNPSDAKIVNLNLTNGDSENINSTSFNKFLTDFISCKQKNDLSACSRIQTSINNSVSVSSDKNLLSQNSNLVNLSSLISNQGLNVQIPVLADSCTQNNNLNTGIKSPNLPNLNYYSYNLNSSNSLKQIAGFATMNISEISTGNKKFIRAQVVCDEKISGFDTAPAGNISFGTIVQNKGRLVRNPTGNINNSNNQNINILNEIKTNPQLPRLENSPTPIYTPPAWGCY